MPMLFVPQSLAERRAAPPMRGRRTRPTSAAPSTWAVRASPSPSTTGRARRAGGPHHVVAGATQSASSTTPTIAGAEVSVAAVDAMHGTAGAGAGCRAVPRAYLVAGFDAVANPARCSPTCASWRGRQGRQLDIASLPERAGGLMRPDLAIRASKVLGPVPDVEKVVRGSSTRTLHPRCQDPRQLLPQGAGRPNLSGLTPAKPRRARRLDPASCGQAPTGSRSRFRCRR